MSGTIEFKTYNPTAEYRAKMNSNGEVSKIYRASLRLNIGRIGVNIPTRRGLADKIQNFFYGGTISRRRNDLAEANFDGLHSVGHFRDARTKAEGDTSKAVRGQDINNWRASRIAYQQQQIRSRSESGSSEATDPGSDDSEIEKAFGPDVPCPSQARKRSKIKIDESKIPQGSDNGAKDMASVEDQVAKLVIALNLDKSK